MNKREPSSVPILSLTDPIPGEELHAPADLVREVDEVTRGQGGGGAVEVVVGRVGSRGPQVTLKFPSDHVLEDHENRVWKRRGL